MTKEELRDTVQSSLQLATGAAAFNALVYFVKENRPAGEKGKINWDVATDVVNDNEAAFIDWLNSDAPAKFYDWRDETVPKVMKSKPKKDDGILVKKNLNPDQRQMIRDLEDIREMVNRSGEEGFSLSKAIANKKLDPKFCTAIVKEGIATKRRSNLNFRKYVWSWKGGKVDYKMLVRLDQRMEQLRKEYAEATKKKKEEKKKAEALAKEATQPQLALKDSTPKPITHKSEGALLSPDAENDLRAKIKGINPEDLQAVTDHYKKQKVKPQKEKETAAALPVGDIPINISVTTEGEKKTVSISIEI